MDRCRSRLKLSENFERHWSIRISVGKFTWINHWSMRLFLGKFVWTNGPESSPEVSRYTGIGPWIALPSKEPKSHYEGQFYCNIDTERSCSKAAGLSKDEIGP